jgi:hypothetical protein
MKSNYSVPNAAIKVLYMFISQRFRFRSNEITVRFATTDQCSQSIWPEALPSSCFFPSLFLCLAAVLDFPMLIKENLSLVLTNFSFQNDLSQEHWVSLNFLFWTQISLTLRNWHYFDEFFTRLTYWRLDKSCSKNHSSGARWIFSKQK